MKKHSLEQSHRENRPPKRFSLDTDQVEGVEDLFKPQDFQLRRFSLDVSHTGSSLIDVPPRPESLHKNPKTTETGRSFVSYTLVRELPPCDAVKPTSFHRDQKDVFQSRIKLSQGEDIRVIDQEKELETIKEFLCKQKIKWCAENQNHECPLGCGEKFRGKVDLKRHLSFHIKLFENQIKIKKKLEKTK